jgi:hypothetical protein
VQGSDTQWYKNVLKNPSIQIKAGSAEAEFKVAAITNAKQVSSVVEKFRAKYGASDVKKYYFEVRRCRRRRDEMSAILTHARADFTSVREKSRPLNNSASSLDLASAYEKQSPKFNLAGWPLVFPKSR